MTFTMQWSFSGPACSAWTLKSGDFTISWVCSCVLDQNLSFLLLLCNVFFIGLLCANLHPLKAFQYVYIAVYM